MTDAITRPLAALMAALHPGPYLWDIPGCAAAISKATRQRLAPPDQLAHAAVDLAKRADLRTPALLADDGPWWHTGRTPDVRVEPARCTVPGHEHEYAHACRTCAADRHAGVDIADPPGISADQAARNAHGAAGVRAALKPAGDGETTEGANDE